jgi:GTP-binding protein
MSFIDKVRVYAKGGDGGDGCLSFRREKYRPFGGPDGGDGGRGGDVSLVADPNRSTLLDFMVHPHLKAGDGTHGKGSDKAGSGGRDLDVRAPLGTQVFKGGRLVADLTEKGARVRIARGGSGGRGNAAFKTRWNTAPRIKEKGEPGEKAVVDLELKLIADIGLVGFPNAGKSTLLARVSNARPKIAAYPFTTLSPNLGLVRHKGLSFVLADIPGLIEGAHAGRGLGDEFLRHVERTRLLIHLVDPMGFDGRDPVSGVRVIEAEMRRYSRPLAGKPRLLVVNKADLPEARGVLKRLRSGKRRAFSISAVTGDGVDRLLDEAVRALAALPKSEPPQEPVQAPGAVRIEKGFEVSAPAPGRFRVSGRVIERLTAMTDMSLEESLRRYRNVLCRIGVDKALRRAGVREGDTVSIGEAEFDWVEEGERP